MKYQKGSETPIEAESVEELLSAFEAESSDIPEWVAEAASKGRLRIQRNLIEIVGGTFAATATPRDMLCFDVTKDEGNQIFYLSGNQFRHYKRVSNE